MLKHIMNMMTGGEGKQSDGPSLDTLLEHMDRELNNFVQLVPPSPEARPRTPFDSDIPVEQKSTANMTPKQMMRLIPDMLPLMLGMKRSSKFYDGTFQPTESEADPAFIEKLEALAYRSGVASISYIKVPHNAIFQHKGIPYEYAIVFTVEMDKEPIDTAPSFEAFHEVAKGYKNLAIISNKLTKVMRKAGFAAYPGTALGGLTDYPHLAELAGLGAIGYHGLLISPESGARLRINTIYTNITNLPIKHHEEHLWVRDFCAMCKKCVRKCPVEAIYDEPRLRPDGSRQCIDHGACRDYFAANYGCAVCLAVCPFSQAGYERLHARFRGNDKAPQIRIPLEPVQVFEKDKLIEAVPMH